MHLSRRIGTTSRTNWTAEPFVGSCANVVESKTNVRKSGRVELRLTIVRRRVSLLWSRFRSDGKFMHRLLRNTLQSRKLLIQKGLAGVSPCPFLSQFLKRDFSSPGI